MKGTLRAWLSARALSPAVVVFAVGIMRTAGAQPVMRVGDSITCPACRIELTRVAAFGDSVGPGYLGNDISDVEIDSRGRLIVTAYNRLPNVYDSTGRFISQVGRVGAGPGEFRSATNVEVGAADTLYFVDNNWMVVYSPALVLVREVNLATAVTLVPRFVNESTMVFLRSTPPRTGVPLMAGVYDIKTGRAEPKWSFARDGDVARTGRPTIAALAKGHTTDFWTHASLDYRISAWDKAGNEAQRIVRNPAWWQPMRENLPAASRPPVSLLTGVFVQPGDTVWTISRLPSPDYRNYAPWNSTSRSARPGELDATTPMADMHKVLDTRIEVIDARTGRLLASRTFSGHLIAFLHSGYLVSRDADSNGNPILILWRYQLAGRR